MKKNKSFILFTLLIIYTSAALFGQNAFDTKKKNNNVVNTSSLHAKSIRGNSSAAANHLVSQPLIFPTAKNKAISTAITDEPKRVLRSAQTNLPIFIESENTNSSNFKSAGLSVKEQTYQYLHQLKPILNIDTPEEQFEIGRINRNVSGATHVRLNQVYKGIKVYAAEAVVHLDATGNGKIFNGRYFTLENSIDVNPTFSGDEVIKLASGHLNSNNKKTSSSGNENLLSKFEIPVYDLVIYKPNLSPAGYKLTYHITLYSTDHHRWEYFIDAHTGEVLHYFENTCYADGAKTASANDLNGVSRTVNTYQIGSNYYLLDASRTMFNSAGSALPDDPLGAIVTIDMNNTFGDNQTFKYITTTNNSWSNPTAVSAHYNAGVAYEYYRQKHSRNSIDGAGGNIMSIINVPDIETGEPLDNAFWNGKFMCYGNGSVAFEPLAGSLDVAGHEMTHGVVENTAALIYEGESGAINESMADIFGAMMDSDDWHIGEDVVKIAAFPSGALRSLSDPHNGGSSLSDMGYQPKHMNEKYTGSEDNYGVHINSGIPNYAFYLFATAIGKEKAAGVYYKALDDYLTKSSQFIDLRLAVIQSATDLYGETSDEVTQAKSAFDAVGVTDGQGTGNDEELPENNGNEYVLVYNTDLNDVNTLYRSNLDQTVLDPLTTTEFISRPSVTDDGSVAVFVAGDKTLHAIVTSPENTADEFVLQEETIWSNAVISKDGNRLAAVTTYIDTAIYVYDFVSETWTKFYLYNPTYTEGVTSAGPLYADALEFDYTGEFLVYDCFNSLANSDGTDIEYWDVNFIRVWNNESNEIGDGEIFKLFSSLPENVSIGNPSFSKNSTNIIAFDYFSSNPEEYYILGCNIETNEVNTLITNTTLGWPSFNKDDSRLAFSSVNLSAEPEIDYVLLNADKISVQGNVLSMFTQAKWPVYFSVGSRQPSSVSDKGEYENEITVYPNPFSSDVTILLPATISGTMNLEVINSTGQMVYSAQDVIAEGGKITANLEPLKPGFYLLKIHNAKTVLSVKILKE